jgi:hypothetical protein
LHFKVAFRDCRFPAIQETEHIGKLGTVVRSEGQPESWRFSVIPSCVDIGKIVEKSFRTAVNNIASQVMLRQSGAVRNLNLLRDLGVLVGIAWIENQESFRVPAIVPTRALDIIASR